MKKTINFIAAIATLLFVSTSSFAQENSDDLLDMSLEDLLNVDITTASKSSQSVNQAPATIFVITADQIKSKGYFNLEEALEDIPGIEIQRKAVTETSNHYSFRGISGNDKFVVLLDGVRVSSIVGTPHAISNNYSIANAKRIEVILGPASALYGADAFSGIVNIITREGGEDFTGLEVATNYGSFNTAENNIRIGGKTGEIKFSLNGKYYHSDEPNFAKEYPNEYSWFNNEYQNNGQVRLAPQPILEDIIVNAPLVEYRTPTDAYFLHARFNFKDFEVGVMKNFESHSSSVGGRPEYNIYDKDATYDIGITSFYLKHSYITESKKFGVESTISHGIHELKPESKFVNTFTSYMDGFKYGKESITKFDEQLTWNLKENISLIGGFSFEDINALPKTGDLPFMFDVNMAADLQDIYYLGTNIADQFGNDLTVYQDFYYLNYQNYGSYLQFQGLFSEKVGITLGGRVDYNTRYGLTVNPRAGVTFMPTKKLNFKLLYGQAYLAPSPYTAYQHYGAFLPTTDAGGVNGLTGPFWHLPNPDLEPEKLNSIELGTGFTASENLIFSANGYYNMIDNLIVIDGFVGESFHDIPIDFVERPVNKGSATTFGFTVRGDYMINIGKSVINTNLSYIYSDGDIDGQAIPYSAKNTVKAELAWKLNNFNVSARIINRSKSLHGLLNDANGNPLEVDGFTLLNLTATYRLINKDKFKGSVLVKVINLTNAKYYNPTLGAGELFTGSPQDPIRINVGVRIDI